MKCNISMFLALALMGLLIFGCDSIIDQGPNSDIPVSGDNPAQAVEPSSAVTMEMCKVDPGWKALGYKNLGQCLRYVQTGTGSAPTVTDIDGNIYPIVNIGDQWWMAENLRTTSYRNGEAIPTGLDDTEWANTTSGAYAIYPHQGGITENDVEGINSDAEMVDAYGMLYNWYAVDDNLGLCPTGWHVPSDAEWTTLVDHLGGAGIAGGKMKSTRTYPDPHPRWDLPNAGANNESGFSGLPGGERLGYPLTYGYIGGFGNLWSSTEDDTEFAWSRVLHDNVSIVDRDYHIKWGGFSVRCLMD
jgi:uncharacterized protein (TIGR02145 family)